MVVLCRLFGRPPNDVEDLSLQSGSSGSVYTAFPRLYFAVAVRFVAVVVRLEVEPGWREGREGAAVTMAGVMTPGPWSGGLDGRSTVSVVDSVQEHVRSVGDQGNEEDRPMALMYFLNCLATLNRNTSGSHCVQLSREALPSGT